MKRLHHPTLARTAALFLILLLLAAGVGCAGRHRRTEQTAPLPDGDLALFPEAASFEAIETGDPEAKYGDGQIGDTRILRAEALYDAAKTPLGYVIVLENQNAYNPPLTLALGIRPDGTTAGIVFLELNETPGKGSHADEPEFKDQFRDRSVDDLLENRDPWNGNIEGLDAISGSTVTSKAVFNAVSAGLDFYRTAIAP
jgi:electron transport complex protein RnfG